jgi:hypothetical protein
MLTELWVEEGAQRPSRNLRQITPRSHSLRSDSAGTPMNRDPER